MKNLKENIICGNHSGFPYCCILYYAFFWKLLFKGNKFRNKLCKLFHKYYSNFLHEEEYFRKSYRTGAGYVKCPMCVLSGYTVYVKICACSGIPMKEKIKLYKRVNYYSLFHDKWRW